MKLYALMILSVISLLSCDSGNRTDSIDEKQNNARILFIGNSYTFNNNLPDQVGSMAAETYRKTSFEVKSVTPGGAALRDHSKSSSTLETLKNGDWDIVVIQGHSLETLKDPFGFRESGQTLIQTARNSGSDVFLFETWSRADGDPVYNTDSSGRSPQKMQDCISAAYAALAHETGAVVIPVGTVWQTFLNTHPDMILHSADGSHPSPEGSFLAAITIYSTIFNADPTQLRYRPSEVSRKEAKTIRLRAE